MTLAVDELIEHLAAGPLGLVTGTQRAECGVSGNVIDRSVRVDRLRPVQGVGALQP
jgi:hypothetical protein